MKKKLNFILAVGCLFSFNAFAHGPHEHGTAKIDIAFDKTNVKINFEAPAISMYGFEHIARTPAQRAAVATTIKRMQDQFLSLVVFPAQLQCKIKNSHIDGFV